MVQSSPPARPLRRYFPPHELTVRRYAAAVGRPSSLSSWSSWKALHSLKIVYALFVRGGPVLRILNDSGLAPKCNRYQKTRRLTFAASQVPYTEKKKMINDCSALVMILRLDSLSDSLSEAFAASTLKSANWRPSSHVALNGLGILCLGMCYRRFGILLCSPNGVSNEHSCSDRIF